MKKFLFLLITAFMLILLAGCKTTKTAVKQLAESKATEQVTATGTTETSGQSLSDIAATLQQEQRQNVVIEFEETEYYPEDSGQLQSGFAQSYRNRPTAERTESSKPPNAGHVKKRTKGKITINAVTATNGSTTASTKTTASSKQQVKQKKETTGQTKSSTKMTEKKTVRSWKDYLWLILVLAIFAAGVCYLLLRRSR